MSDVLNFMKDHIKRYLATGGEDGHLMNGVPCLVLTTVGKKSGEQRQVAIIYGKSDSNYVVVASKGGSDQSPAWFHNLKANKTATIQVKDKVMPVAMRITEGAERAELWDTMAAVFPDYLEYQQSTSREIPVVVLEPLN